MTAPWLTELPHGWREVALRYLARVETGSRDTVDAVPGAEFPFIVRSPKPLEIDTYSYDTEAVLTAGDGAVGEVFHHVTGKFEVHQRVYVVRDFRGLDGRFFFYYFSSQFGQTVAYGGAQSTVASLRRPMFTEFPVAVPPVETQRAIADYLDRETAQIDAFIAKNEELIALLTERSEAQHLRLVLEQPVSDRVPLKAVLRKLRRTMTDGAAVVTAFRDGQVTSRSNRRLGGFTETETDSRGGYQGVKVGDVVYHGLDGFAGAVGVSESDGICSPVYHVCEVSPRAEAEYIALLLQALGKSGYLESSAWSVRQRSVDYRNWATFSRLVIDLPPITVQREVVDTVSASTKNAARAMAVAQRSVELARERRAALISAAVTGKIDVASAGSRQMSAS